LSIPQNNTGTKREIVAALQTLFDQHNELIRVFRIALNQMPADKYRVLVKADKTPNGQHENDTMHQQLMKWLWLAKNLTRVI